MESDPNAPDTLDDRSPSASDAAKPRERYNTNYIVDNFTRQERRNRMIVAGLAVALVLCLGLGLLLNSKHHPPAPMATDGAPAEGAAPPAESAH